VALIIIDIPLSWIVNISDWRVAWSFTWFVFAFTGLSDTTAFIFGFYDLVSGEVAGWVLDWSTWCADTRSQTQTFGTVFESE
jgi:hypothetical protein